MPINVPSVVGVNLKKKLKEGVTATDLVLNLTNLLSFDIQAILSYIWNLCDIIKLLGKII